MRNKKRIPHEYGQRSHDLGDIDAEYAVFAYLPSLHLKNSFASLLFLIDRLAHNPSNFIYIILVI